MIKAFEQAVTVESFEAMFVRGMKIAPLAMAIEDARDWRVRLQAIRAYYAEVQRDIDGAKPWEWAYDVYEVDWPMLFSPIESMLWKDIREQGIVLYPQYPMRVLDDFFYYADFANPARRVCIECDGKMFHDAAKDAERDRRLSDAGWKVFRFTGSQCRQDFNETTMQRSQVSRELERIARCYLDERPEPAQVARKSRGFE